MNLILRGLQKTFGSHIVLQGIDLSLEQIHCLCLIGPSGGGKSTLLRMMAGLAFPDEGEIILNGESIIFEEKKLLAYRRRIGTVFQAFNLFSHLTAIENITLPLEKVHGWRASEAKEKAWELLNRFQLKDHAKKRPSQLSGGQRQRVAIVRALAIEPQVFLFDEPTSSLDPEMTAEILEVIEELKQEKKDLIIATHEIGFARKVGDYVALLGEGRILEEGPPHQVLEAPLSSQGQNFLAKVLRY